MAKGEERTAEKREASQCNDRNFLLVACARESRRERQEREK